MKENYMFFLGGYDLEMMTIAEILQEKRLEIYDHKLTWVVNASAYEKEIENLKPGQTHVLVELEIDMKLPSNTIISDLHNERKTDKSTLDQLVELFGMELNRELQLFAVNDKAIFL